METFVRSKFCKKCSRTFKILFAMFQLIISNKLSAAEQVSKNRFLNEQEGIPKSARFSEERMNIIGARLHTFARQF